jgi:ABC-type nitrate/sulfonate/bicarbonate transport system permease component
MTSKQKLLESLAPWLILAGVVAAWQLIVSGFGVSEFIFPGPVAIIRSLATYAGPIGQHAWQTFWSTMIGFGLGIGVGVILGLIVGSSRLMFKGSASTAFPRWRLCLCSSSGSVSAQYRRCLRRSCFVSSRSW